MQYMVIQLVYIWALIHTTVKTFFQEIIGLVRPGLGYYTSTWRRADECDASFSLIRYEIVLMLSTVLLISQTRKIL